RFPYAAIGFSDFWRRWHISLSTFLRDYLYIPLGGNRLGWTRAAINLVIVMFLGGLWHGAAWTFVVWGLLHGSYLVIEHASRALIGERAWTENFAVNLLLGFVTYGPVCLAWVFFRASDFTIATLMLRGMFGCRVCSSAPRRKPRASTAVRRSSSSARSRKFRGAASLLLLLWSLSRRRAPGNFTAARLVMDRLSMTTRISGP